MLGLICPLLVGRKPLIQPFPQRCLGWLNVTAILSFPQGSSQFVSYFFPGLAVEAPALRFAGGGVMPMLTLADQLPSGRLLILPSLLPRRLAIVLHSSYVRIVRILLQQILD